MPPVASPAAQRRGPDRQRSCAPAATACGAENSGSGVRAPGAPEARARAASTPAPPPCRTSRRSRRSNAYPTASTSTAAQIKAQMEAHHYCANVNEDVIQCVIYDGNVAGAKLMGVEYIVSGSAVPDPAGRGEAALAQPRARGPLGAADRAGHPGSGREGADEEARRHLRQDLAHLAHRPAEAAAARRAAADDGLHRRRPDRPGAASPARDRALQGLERGQAPRARRHPGARRRPACRRLAEGPALQIADRGRRGRAERPTRCRMPPRRPRPRLRQGRSSALRACAPAPQQRREDERGDGPRDGQPTTSSGSRSASPARCARR